MEAIYFLNHFVWLCQSQPSLVRSPCMWTGERDSPQVEHFQAATEYVKRKTQKGRKKEREILVHRDEMEATPCEPCKHAVCVCV